jgi:hypothetical protein
MTITGVTEPPEVFRSLFTRAKAADEFEFCCALLRFRGVEDPGWDPTTESFQLIQQMVSLVQAPFDQRLIMRLTLSLYAHVTEMTDLYCVPANMLRIIQGERYSMDPLKGLPKPPKPGTGDPLGGEAVQLIGLATKVGIADVAKLYSTLYIRQVRNAFSHSAYGLGAETFNMRRGEPLTVDGMLQHAIPYDWLVPRLELGVNTALALFGLILDSTHSYTQDKIVKGRFSHDESYVDIQLTTDPNYGLTGFRSPPDAPAPTT